MNGQKLGTYSLSLNGSVITATTTQTAVFFGAKRVAVNGAAFVPDRLGSNMAGKYYPYGEDRGTPIQNDQVKYATYTRDSATGMDYADQRYYSNQFGRMMTPDPYTNSGRFTDPQSWNRYVYTRGDPINRRDPSGIDDCGGEGEAPCPIHEFFGCLLDPNSNVVLCPSSEGETPGCNAVSAKEGYCEYNVADPDSAGTKKVDATLYSLRRALDSDPNCLNFLETGIAGGDVSVFNKYYNQLMGFSGPPLAGATDFRGTDYSGYNGITGWIGSGYIVTINTSGAFFNAGQGVGYALNYDAQVSALQGGTQAGQFFILLHELAHFFQAQGFDQNDQTRGQQEFNNDLLWEKCSKTVQSAPGGHA